MTLADRIAAILRLAPDAPAIEYAGRWTMWGEVGDATRALDAVLTEGGFEAGARVAVLLRNHVRTVPAVLAVLTGDRCLVALNPILPAEKVKADLAATQVPAIVGLGTDLDALGSAIEEAGCMAVELTGRAGDPVVVRRWREDKPGHLLANPGVAVEMLTSGTTGPPKRIPLRKDNFIASVLAAARFEKGRSADDRPMLRSGIQLLMAPFAHIGGLMALLNAVVAGRSAVLLEKFSVAAFRDAVSRHGIKVVSAPPAALKMVLDAEVRPAELQSLRAFRTGTAPLNPDLADAFYDRYQIPVLQNYGATEFGGVAGWTIDDFAAFRQAKRGSVGRFNPGVAGRIVDAETGAGLGAGEPGILELSGRQIGKGADWLRTTDIARLDEDGFLFILGRSDNAIVRGGFKVHPDDIVRAAEGCPGVREAAVVALPDERLGQVPAMAFLQKAGAETPTAADLIAHLRATLSPYQVPTEIRLLDDLPRTPALKVDQAALRRIFEADR